MNDLHPLGILADKIAESVARMVGNARERSRTASAHPLQLEVELLLAEWDGCCGLPYCTSTQQARVS